MCGIAFTSFDPGQLRSMRHRGPDGHHRVAVGPGVLHHSLLAVHGEQHQPIAVGDTLVAYNGEIYGVHDDSTAMAEGFVAHRDRFLHTINGDWALLAVDHDTVTAVRDRYGLRPLFRYWDGEKLIYASNIAIIAEALATRDEGLVPSPRYPPRGRVPYPSAYLYIEPLPAGTMERAVFDGDKWRFFRRRWYELRPRQHGDLAGLIQSATRLRAHEHGSVAVSGGVDSYLIEKAAPPSMTRYHLDVTGEAEVVRGAVILQPPHISETEVAEVLEQPYYALPPNLFLARAIRQHDPKIRVVLTGLGADELFGGYEHHQKPFNKETWRAAYGIPRDWSCTDWREAELAYPIPYHYGYRTDQAFLRYGIEVRHPYMDHRVVETALWRPADGKVHLRALAVEQGWQEQPKRGFSADLRGYLHGQESVALAGLAPA